MICIVPNCQFAKEASNYFDKDTVQSFLRTMESNEFKELVSISAKFLNTHEDGSLTLKSFLSLVPAYNAKSSEVVQVTIPNLNKQLKEVAKSILGGTSNVTTAILQINGEDRTCITNLNFEQAQNIQLAFNRSNPFSQQYIANVEHTISGSYQVVVRNRDDATYLQMRREQPKFEAIEAVCNWFKRLGINITFDNINNALSANIITRATDEIGEDGKTYQVLTSLVSVCGDRDLDAISDIPEDIADDVANAVAKILIDVFNHADIQDISPQYTRFKNAVQQYKRNEGLGTSTDEEVMQMFLKEEIRNRILKGINKATNKSEFRKSVSNSMKYGRSWAKRFIDSIISKWKTTKKLLGKSIKPLSIKSIQREARLAVDDLFQKRTKIIRENQGAVDTVNGAVRKHHKRILKAANEECKTTFGILYAVERSLKKYINGVSGKERKTRMTEFESLISMINNTDDVFKNSDVRALQAIGQTVLTLAYEFDDISVDLQQLGEQLEAISEDSSTLNNMEYVDKLKQFATLKQKFNTFVEIYGLLQQGVKRGVLNSSITVIDIGGNTREFSLKTNIENLANVIAKQQTAMTALNATVAENFLVDIWGQDQVKFIKSKALRKLGKKLDESRNSVASFRKTQEIVHESLTDINKQSQDWFLQRWLGSMQNSSSIVNQLVGLALNQAKTIGQQETQKTLGHIQKIRREHNKNGVDVEILVERDERGIPTGNLVRPVDYYKYEQELKAAERKWQEEFCAKYKNAQLNDTQKAMYWSAFRQNKFNEWNKEIDPKTKKVTYKFKKQQISLTNPRTGEVEPIMIYAPNPEKYSNSEWYRIPEASRKLSNELMALKYYSNTKLDGQGSSLHKIPNFRGSFTDTIFNNKKNLGVTAMQKVRRNFVADFEDTEFGSVVTELPMLQKDTTDWAQAEMDFVRRIPLYGIRPLRDMQELSTDLYSSYLAYDDMANQYATKNSIESLIQSVGDQLQNTGKEYEKDKHRSNRYYEQFLDYIDKELYGITKKNHFNTGLIAINKHLNVLSRIVTAAFLGGNFHSAMVNLITGYNEIIKEAGVGQYININDFREAFGFYIKNSAAKLIGCDNGNYNVAVHPNDSSNILSVILRSFDFTERYQQDTRNYNTRELRVVRTLKDSLMLPYEYTDHWMQTIPLICFLKHQKVYTQADPNNNNKSYEIPLLEALFPQVKNGRFEHLLQSPKGIESDGNFGLFYKSPNYAEEGGKIVSLIQKLKAHVQEKIDNPNAVIHLSDEDIKILNDANLPINISDNSAMNTIISTLKNKLYKLTYNGADFAQTRLLAREIVNRMHGVYDTQSKGAFQRTIYGATFMSMKNYAVGLLNRRFGQPHYSVLTQEWDEGSVITTTKAIWDAFCNDSHQNKVVYLAKSLFNIIMPFALSTKASKQRMVQRTGFTEGQIYNIQRNKLDMLRILLFQLLTHMIKALGKGWIGGWDPEDKDLFYEYTGIKVYDENTGKEEKVDREELLSGEAFEDGGILASNPKLSTILEEIKGVKDDEGNSKFKSLLDSLTPFEKQVWDRLVSEADKSNKAGDPIRFDAYGNSENGFTSYLDEIYKEEEDAWNSTHTDKIDLSKTNQKNNVDYKLLKKFCKNELITTDEVKVEYVYDKNGNIERYQRKYKEHKKGDPKTKTTYTVRVTPIKDIKNQRKDVKEKINDLEYALQYTEDPEKKKQLQKTIGTYKKKELGYADILHASEYWMAKKIRTKLDKELKQWANKSGLPEDDIDNIAKHYVAIANDDSKAFKDFKMSYDENQDMLKRQAKYFSSKTFENEYFQNTHPTAYYLLGVADYFIYRGLLEQESFIPGAGITTSLVEKMFTETIPKWITGKRLIPEVERDWEWNFSNEWSSLTSDVAAIGLGRTAGKFTDVFMGSLLYNEDYIEWSREQDEKYKQSLETDNVPSDYLRADTPYEYIQEQREKEYEMFRNIQKYRAKNSTTKLEKDESLWRKWPRSFIPYYRSYKMFGIGDFLNKGKVDGGWRAIDSYKSFYLKDNKG